MILRPQCSVSQLFSVVVGGQKKSSSYHCGRGSMDYFVAYDEKGRPSGLKEQVSPCPDCFLRLLVSLCLLPNDGHQCMGAPDWEHA